MKTKKEIFDLYEELLKDNAAELDRYLNGNENIFLDKLEKDAISVEEGEDFLNKLEYIKYDFVNKQRQRVLQSPEYEMLEPRSFNYGLMSGIEFYRRVLNHLKSLNKTKEETPQ